MDRRVIVVSVLLVAAMILWVFVLSGGKTEQKPAQINRYVDDFNYTVTPPIPEHAFFDSDWVLYNSLTLFENSSVQVNGAIRLSGRNIFNASNATLSAKEWVSGNIARVSLYDSSFEIPKLSAGGDSYITLSGGQASFKEVSADGNANIRIVAVEYPDEAYFDAKGNSKIFILNLKGIGDNAVLSGKLPVYGRALEYAGEGDLFSSWRLEYGVLEGKDVLPYNWTVISQSNFQKNGLLAEWNTLNLTNGNYSLRLIVEDVHSRKVMLRYRVTVVN